jgi:hypothetical protein
MSNGFQTRALLRACIEHRTLLVEGLKNVVHLPGLQIHRSVISMEYGPWFRHIVAEEDIQEALHRKKERKGRNTRNSGGGYVRIHSVSTEEREALAATALVWTT